MVAHRPKAKKSIAVRHVRTKTCSRRRIIAPATATWEMPAPGYQEVPRVVLLQRIHLL